MNETQAKKKGVNWISIVLAIVFLMAVKLIQISMREKNADITPSGVKSAEELGITEIVIPPKVDVFNDGRIVVDGVQKSLSEIGPLIDQWHQSKGFISFYHEPPAAGEPAQTDPVGDSIRAARLNFLPRSQPQ